MSTGKIPGPYVNDTKQDDGIMEYVPMNTMGIGARMSGLPKGSMNQYAQHRARWRQRRQART